MKTPGLVSGRKSVEWGACLSIARRQIREIESHDANRSIVRTRIVRADTSSDLGSARWQQWASDMARTTWQ